MRTVHVHGLIFGPGGRSELTDRYLADSPGVRVFILPGGDAALSKKADPLVPQLPWVLQASNHRRLGFYAIRYIGHDG